jgi:hypothetical protein
LVASLGLSRATGVHIRVPISGYDPRDLLAGHYISFAFDTGKLECSSQRGEPWCLCYQRKPGSDSALPYAGYACEHLPEGCATFVRGYCDGGRFITGTERYSIPERLAPALAQIPPGSSVMLSLNARGEALIGQVFIGEETIESFAEKQLAERSKGSSGLPAVGATPVS